METISSVTKFLFCCCTLTLLIGCSSDTVQNFRIESLAKSELDMVIDAHLSQTSLDAITLMKKLYKRNPTQLAKAPKTVSVDKRIKQLFGHPRQIQFNELGSKYANSALILAFDSDFQGDRVFAFMAGISGILHSAYNYQDEFFMLDSINEQKVYNSARNLETASWLLNNSKDSATALYLLSNSYTNQQTTANLSYERLFGKIIASQDILANIIANRNNRTINKVLHGVASTTLLPL